MLIVKQPSKNNFKFGSGKVFPSLFLVSVPVTLADCKVNLQFDVVDSEIPFLCGKASMKEWHVVIDTNKETATLKLNGVVKDVDLYTSKSGHWCLSLKPSLSMLESVETYFSVAKLTKDEKLQSATHIHRQFCHPPFTFLAKIMKSFGDVDVEFLSILEKCQMSV